MRLFHSLYHSVQRHALPLALLISLAALATAFVSQYGFGTFPCELCLYQRIPYALIALTAASALFPPSTWRLPPRYALILITLLFLIEAGLGWYHVSVEAGLVSSSCATQGGGGETLDELRAMIQAAPIVSCSDVGAEFLGVSMALWNALAASGFLGIFLLISMAKRER